MIKKPVNKWVKWALIACLTPVGLLLLLAILLYIPPVQRFVVQKTVRIASEATGMTIRVDRIRLSFPLDLAAGGVEVLSAPGDTLLSMDEIALRIKPLPLLRRIVTVEAVRLRHAHVDSGTFIEGIAVRGNINSLAFGIDGINPQEETATLGRISLSGADIALRIDSLPQDDTAPEPVNWKIQLGRIDVENTAFDLAMPADSVWLSALVGEVNIDNILADLAVSRYTIGQIRLSRSGIRFDANRNEPAAGLDPEHIALSEIDADLRSVVYRDREMAADIRRFSMKERSGLSVSSLTGEIKSDSLHILIPRLEMETAASRMRMEALIPWSLTAETPATNDSLRLSLSLSLGKDDLFLAAPQLPDSLKRAWPDKSINLIAGGEGTLESLKIKQLMAELPGTFRMSAAGRAGNITDSVRRSANVRLEATAHNMDFITAYLSPDYRIPSGTTLQGTASLSNRQILADMELKDNDAEVSLTAAWHLASEAYTAGLRIRNLSPVRYMPSDSILWVDATLKAEGKGTDIYSPATWTDISATIDSIQYINTALSRLTLSASLKENQAHAEMNSDNPGLKAALTVDGSLGKDGLSGIVILDAERIDLEGMHLADSTFNTSFNLFAELESDRKERNRADVTIGNWDIQAPGVRLRQQLLTLKAHSDEDTTQLSLHAGDLGIVLTGNAGLNTLSGQLTTVAAELNRQLAADSMLNIAKLRPSLPDMDLRISAKRDNPLYRLLQRYYLNYTDIDIHAATSPQEGIRLDAGIYAFARDTFLIDTLKARIRPDPEGLTFAVDVIKNRYRRQMPFFASLNGAIRNNRAEAEVLFKNRDNRTGLLLGISAVKESEGYTFNLFPEQPVIAFNTFRLNSDNYLRFRSMNNMEANIRLDGNENASLWVHSDTTNGAYPEVMAEIGQLNLAILSGGMDIIPEMRGLLSATLRYAPDEESFMIVADANVDDLYYEKGRVGEMMLNAVYLPLEDSRHQVDVHLYHDRSEISSAYALLHAGERATGLEGTLAITKLPLPMLNPFIPGGMARMEGSLNGEMSITGSTDRPVLDGFMQMDSSSAYLSMADMHLRFDSKKVTVGRSLISFDRYNIYSAGNNPFVINGNIDISDLSRMMADLKMTASNMQVLDAKRTRESLVYGRLLMDFDTTIKGPFSGLVVRGNAHLRGGTDMTYVLTDSPLSVQDRMDGLVTFTSFTDTLTRERRSRAPAGIGGVDMLMALHIDPTVQMRADLNPDQSNFVEVEGGGDLTFQMNRQGDMLLNGRYVLSEGIVKYSLPVVPLKEFNIRQGSFVQWDGEIMNPLIDVVATERIRATVTRDGNQRKSNFDVGISVRNRLDDMDMTFIIESVDDRQAMEELAKVSVDERTRWAIYMMITGSYMESEASGSGVNVDAVISNFLMGEVNNIAGDVLKGVDINLGLDTYEAEGQTRRDLTFSFSKRFYNDRIRVTAGGKVAMENQQQAESFLDNFAAEYLLDAAGSKTVKFFYDRNYDMLEGEIVQTGVGIVLRKKMLRLREIFDFRRKKLQPVEEEPERQVTDVERNNPNEDETAK